MRKKIIMCCIITALCQSVWSLQSPKGTFMGSAHTTDNIESVLAEKISAQTDWGSQLIEKRSLSCLRSSFAISAYIPGNSGLNNYHEPGHYEFETARGSLSNTPFGTVVNSNFKILSIGSSTRNAQLMYETSSNGIWVRNNWDWGGGMQHTNWERLALRSEFGNSDGLDFSYTADPNSLARRDAGGHILANYYATRATLEIGDKGLNGIFGTNEDQYIRKFDFTSLPGFMGVPPDGETLASVSARDNRSHHNIKLSNINTPNPNMTGADLDYGNLGFFNSDFGIENARVESFYHPGQFVDRGGLKFYTREGDGLVARVVIEPNGNLGIGLDNPSEKLSVNGKVRAREVRVDGKGIPDYVFDESYRKLSLSEIERYIRLNRHLPEVPSAGIFERDGMALGEMNKLLLKKIEELTLHLIDKEKELRDQAERLRKIEKILKINE